MRKFITALFVLSMFATTASSASAEEAAVPAKEQLSATPKITVSVAEGYTVLFKDDGVTPGSASTRFGVSAGWKLPKNFTISVTAGLAVSNTDFKPAPRIIVGVGYVIDDRWSFGGGLLYQVNPGYSNTKTTNLLGVSVGPSVKLGGGFSFSFHVGTAKCVEGGSWALLFQPGFAYTF